MNSTFSERELDKLTSDEEEMIIRECSKRFVDFEIFGNLSNVLDHIMKQVGDLHSKRNEEIFKASKEELKWTNTEVAQLLVAVFNIGEGEWLEIHKRIDFSSSKVIKTPN